MSINFKMDKHEVAYLCNRILFGPKKEVLTQPNPAKYNQKKHWTWSQKNLVEVPASNLLAYLIYDKLIYLFKP